MEFVSSDLSLTVGENLLSLSVQKSPNLFVFRVVSEFLDLQQRVAPFHRDLCYCSQRVAPFYLETLKRRKTRRQAFSFRVIDLSSVRVEKRPTDYGVVEVQFFEEPLLGHGLMIELDLSLCEEVLVGLTTLIAFCNS